MPARMTISVLNRNEIGAIWPGAPHFLGSRCQNAADRSVALTAYKSYSFPADDLGAFAVSHANVWRCGRKITPLPPLSASILIWLAGFPTDFLVVGSHVCCGFVFLRRGFPTDFPVVGWAWV